MLAKQANTNGYKWIQKQSILATIYAMCNTWSLVLYFPEGGSSENFQKGKSKIEEHKKLDMQKRKCKKKNCWNMTNGTHPLCSAHQFELELKAMQVLNQQKKQENG